MAEPSQAERFERMVFPHLDAAYNLARWLARNDDDARDIVQEAYLRAFRFIAGFHGGDARAWLLAIVRNTYYSWRSRNPPDGRTEEFDEAQHGESAEHDDPAQLLLRAEDARLVTQALAALPPAYREVLVLRELEDLSYRQIAAIAGVPIGTVMSRLARARRLLAAEVRQLAQED